MAVEAPPSRNFDSGTQKAKPAMDYLDDADPRGAAAGYEQEKPQIKNRQRRSSSLIKAAQAVRDSVKEYIKPGNSHPDSGPSPLHPSTGAGEAYGSPSRQRTRTLSSGNKEKPGVLRSLSSGNKEKLGHLAPLKESMKPGRRGLEDPDKKASKSSTTGIMDGIPGNTPGISSSLKPGYGGDPISAAQGYLGSAGTKDL